MVGRPVFSSVRSCLHSDSFIHPLIELFGSARCQFGCVSTRRWVSIFTKSIRSRLPVAERKSKPFRVRPNDSRNQWLHDHHRSLTVLWRPHHASFDSPVQCRTLAFASRAFGQTKSRSELLSSTPGRFPHPSFSSPRSRISSRRFSTIMSSFIGGSEIPADVP